MLLVAVRIAICHAVGSPASCPVIKAGAPLTFRSTQPLLSAPRSEAIIRLRSVPLVLGCCLCCRHFVPEGWICLPRHLFCLSPASPCHGEPRRDGGSPTILRAGALWGIRFWRSPLGTLTLSSEWRSGHSAPWPMIRTTGSVLRTRSAPSSRWVTPVPPPTIKMEDLRMLPVKAFYGAGRPEYPHDRLSCRCVRF